MTTMEIDADPDMRLAPPTVSVQAKRFNWYVQHFLDRITTGINSDIFVIGGYKWRLSLSLFQKNIYGHGAKDYLGVFLHATEAAELPLGWSRLVSISFAVVDQLDRIVRMKKSLIHRDFNQDSTSFGFQSFLPMEYLCDPYQTFLVKDFLIIQTEVDVRKVVHHLPGDSKKETGFVGLKNQGATCYLNAFIQILYHLPYFRKTVYNMATSRNESLSESTPSELSSLFYRIQFSDTSPGTEGLTKSFGWDTSQCLREEDAHEFNVFLRRKLEQTMKGTPVDGTIQQLFEGHAINSIECIDVAHTSTCRESFYDLQLDVKGCRDVYESLDKYIEVEKLEGDNQYKTDEFGLQDARKGAKFIDFPPVLQLHLKRFDYDFSEDTMVKINDRYEFPLKLDLDRENGKYISLVGDRSVCNLYTLHSVLVHSGVSVDSGHYYAFIRPTLSDQWYKFDDDLVTKEESKTVLEEHCGAYGGLNHSNAYMLLYIRESFKDEVICTVDEKDIPRQLQEMLKKEEEAERERGNLAKGDDDLEMRIGKSKTVRLGIRQRPYLRHSKRS